MKPLIMRGFSAGLFLLYCILATIIVSFSLFVHIVLQSNTVPTEVRLLINLIVDVFLLLPGIMMLLHSILSICTTIEIYEEKIKYNKPFQKPRILDVQQMTFWGCVGYSRRSNMLFFCTENIAVVNEYLQTHWDRCLKIFGTNRVNKLQDSEQGLFKLAAGTYLRYSIFGSHNKVFVLQYGSAKRLYKVVQALKKDAILTGPYLIDDEAFWKRYSIYADDLIS